MKIDKLKEIILVLILIILIVFLIKYLNVFKYVKMLIIVLIPLFIGFIYAYLFNPLIKRLSNKYNRNFICITLFLMFIFCFGIFIYFLVPTFYREIIEFTKILPDFFNKFSSKIHNLGIMNYVSKIVDFLVEGIPLYLVNIVSNTFRYIGTIAIGLVLGLYISMDYEKIVNSFYNFVPSSKRCVVINLCNEVSEAVRKCVNGTLLIAFCVFVMDSLCFFFIGIDAPLLLGLVCGITDLIPYVGPYIGGVVAILVGFTESKVLGILTLITCLVVQSIENYILQPIVMSKSIKISPVLVIVGLLVLGKLFGIVGMIMATPCVAILKVLFSKYDIVLEKCKKKVGLNVRKS